MKIFLKRLIPLLVIILSTGCASGPVYDKVISTFPEISPDTGRIYIFRPSAMGYAIQPDVKLNGEVIGEADPQGFFYVDRPAGSYEVVTSTEVDRTLSFTLEKNQTRYVRLRVAMGFFVGHVYPELVEEQEALEDLKYCKYTQGEEEEKK